MASKAQTTRRAFVTGAASAVAAFSMVDGGYFNANAATRAIIRAARLTW